MPDEPHLAHRFEVLRNPARALFHVPPPIAVLLSAIFLFAAYIAWLMMHTAIAERMGEPRRVRWIGLFGVLSLFVGFAGLLFAFDPDFWRRALGFMDFDRWHSGVVPLVRVLSVSLILGGQLVMTWASMASIRPLAQGELGAPIPPADYEPIDILDRAGWKRTRTAVVLMAGCVAVILVVLSIGFAIDFLRHTAPQLLGGPDRDALRTGGGCMLAIAALVFAIGGFLGCLTPSREAAWWARGCAAGVFFSFAIAAGEHRLPRIDNSRALGHSIILTAFLVTFAFLVLFHGAIGRRFGTAAVSIVGAYYFAFSAAAIVFARTIPHVPLPMIAEGVLAMIVLGGYLVLSWLTLAAMRDPLSDR